MMNYWIEHESQSQYELAIKHWWFLHRPDNGDELE